MRSLRQRLAVFTLATPLLLVACGGSTEKSGATASTTTATATAPTATATATNNGPADTADAAEQLYPDVIDAVALQVGETWAFDVTISSPYDTPERYADGWRILDPDGNELGFRLLTHDHASEQPFTRSLSDVSIPDDVDVVTIEGRDQENGFGGDTFELILPH